MGVTSFGPPACLLANHRDDVFTSTESFNPWITEIIGKISNRLLEKQEARTFPPSREDESGCS